VRRLSPFAAAAVVACLVLSGLSGPLRPATAATGSHASSAPAFTQTETISRSFLSGGQETVADTRTVTLDVSQTTNLQAGRKSACRGPERTRPATSSPTRTLPPGSTRSTLRAPRMPRDGERQ